MTYDDYDSALAALRGHRTEIPRRTRWQLMQQWREIFARQCHAQTGRWKYGSYEWHVFTRGNLRSLNGARALAAYEAETMGTLLVVPEDAALPAWRIALADTNLQRPRFAETKYDVYVWPEDFAWTMAFTHEAASGLGPYFCRREWVTDAA